MEMESQSVHQFVITRAASRESQSITPTPGKHFTETFKEVEVSSMKGNTLHPFF